MTRLRSIILRTNAVYLGVASLAGLLFDVRGIFFAAGPQGRILASAPYAGIGFIEAHGLALILSIVLWRASAVREWHLTALAIDVLLGTANLLLWEIFVAADVLPVGYVSTSLHWTFATLQCFAAITSRGMDRAVRDPHHATV